MNINVKMKDNLKMRAFYLFIVIAGLQVGVGILGVPSLVIEEARQDAWLSVIIATVFILLLLFVMMLILKQYDNADILGVQVDIFGTVLGKILGTVYIAYFFISLLSVLLTYIEVVRIFLFPSLNSGLLGFLLLGLIIYSAVGGIRVIVGVCFLFFILSFWVFLLLAQPLFDMDLTHFQPAFQTPLPQLLQGAKLTSYTFTGIEILFFIYPFIQNKNKIKLPTYAAALFSSFLVLVVVIISTGFFTLEQIQDRKWTVFGLFTIQHFAFIERLDYVVVAMWMMIVLPTMLLLMWGITYSTKRLYNIRQKTSLYVTSALLLVASFFMDEHLLIQRIIDITDQFGSWLVYVYPLLLLPIVFIRKRFKKKAGAANAK